MQYRHQQAFLDDAASPPSSRMGYHNTDNNSIFSANRGARSPAAFPLSYSSRRGIIHDHHHTPRRHHFHRPVMSSGGAAAATGRIFPFRVRAVIVAAAMRAGSITKRPTVQAAGTARGWPGRAALPPHQPCKKASVEMKSAKRLRPVSSSSTAAETGR